MENPVHKRILCGHPTVRNDDGVLQCISKLPEELKLEILRRLSLDQLLDLKPSLPLLRFVLPVPPAAAEFEPWLAGYLAKQNRGYVYVPKGNRMFMNNDYNDEDSDNDGYNNDKYEVSDILPSLDPGIYKVRLLQGGFDLVQAGYSFISTQCGPLGCHHKRKEEDWASSFLSRGFNISTEDRSDIASCNWDPRSSWTLPNMQAGGVKGETFFISIKEGFWNNPWKRDILRPFNYDKVSWTCLKQPDDYWFENEPFELGVLRASGGEVVGYSISGRCFYAYDPEGYPHSDEGAYDFSVSRYKYTGETSMVGFIVTGEQNMYGMPQLLLEEDQDSPDRKHYR